MLIRRRFDKPSVRTGRAVRNLSRLVLLGLLLACSVGCGTSSGSGRNAPGTTTAERPQASLHRFVPGERLVYRLDYTSASASDFRALFQEKKNTGAKLDQPAPGLAQSFKTTIRGELTSTVIRNIGDTVLVAYSVQKPEVRLTVNGQDAASKSEEIKTDLGRDVFATVDPQGKVLNVRFEPGVNDLSQNFVKTLLAITQFVLPAATAELRQWEAEEADPSGHYVARYEVVTGSNESGNASSTDLKSINKIKTRYAQHRQNPASDEIQATTAIIPKGSLAARFDLQRGHLISLKGTESQTISIEGKVVAKADNEVQMDLERQETLSQPELAAMLETGSVRERVAMAIPLFVIPSPEAAESSIQRSELGDTSLESLLEVLAKLESSTGEVNETPIYLKVKAMVYLHPEASASFGKILATANAKGPAMRVLTGALGAVGNKEAQGALIEATRSRPGDWPALSLLIPAISQARKPTQTAEDLLRELSFNSPNPDIAATAQLSLGNLARKLAETAPERSANIVQLFTKRIQSSASADVTQQMLFAIGNAGSVEALPVISRLINDQSPTLRAAAATALRWIDSDQADSLLTQALTSDRDATVRMEAALALGFRTSGDSNFKAQKNAFLTEKDVKVRLVLLKNLWSAKENFPEVRGILKQVAAHDRSKEVRKAAAESLGLQ